MHKSSLLRMDYFFKTYIPINQKVKILDVGSMNVNGCYRDIINLKNFEYIGLDMSPGNNVDFVPTYPYYWPELKDNTFDVVISGQAFEHIEFFWLTLQEMVRVLKPNGFLCIICPRGFDRHRYPIDCYRFDADSMVALARYANISLLHASTDMQPKEETSFDWHIDRCEDSMMIAKKPQLWDGFINPKRYIYQDDDITKYQKGFIVCPREITEQKFLKKIMRKLKKILDFKI